MFNEVNISNQTLHKEEELLCFLPVIVRTGVKSYRLSVMLLLIGRAIIYFCPKASFSAHYALLMALWPQLVLVSIITNTYLTIKLSSQIKGQRL